MPSAKTSGPGSRMAEQDSSYDFQVQLNDTFLAVTLEHMRLPPVGSVGTFLGRVDRTQIIRSQALRSA